MNSKGNDRPVSDGGFANTPSKAPFQALNLPLAGLRIVTTRPPLNWFGGVDFDFATEMAEELRALGAAVFELDTRGFIFPNRDYIKAITQELRSFRPDVAMSLPNATYALLCCSGQGNISPVQKSGKVNTRAKKLNRFTVVKKITDRGRL